MKLIKCYISSFGKIKNFTYNFNDGLNEIIQENGWGKTTFATFIKAMFYGLDSGKQSILKNERKKYKSWNTTEKFGGYVIFSRSGKTFKLERYFGTKVTEDTVKLYDEETGREYADTDNLGGRIFQIDEEGFLSTTYFSQEDIEVKSNASLTAKYNAICGDDNGKFFEDAVKRLVNKSRDYVTTGNRGKIADIKRNISDIDAQISRSSMAEQTLKGLSQEIKQLDAELISLKVEMDDISKKIQKSGKIEGVKIKRQQYDSLQKQINETKLKLQLEEKVLNGVKVDDDLLNTYLDCVREIERSQDKAKYIEQDILSLENSTVKAPKKISKKSFYLVAVIALLLCVSCVVHFIMENTVMGIIAGALGLISVVGVAFVHKKNNTLKQGGSTIILLEQKRNELTGYKQVVVEYQAHVDRFLSRFAFETQPQDYRQALDFIKKTLDTKNLCHSEIDRLNNHLKSLGEIEDVDVTTVDSIDNLSRKFDDLQSSYKIKSNRLGDLKASFLRQEEIADKLGDLRSDRATLLEELNNAQSDYEICSQTLKYLQMADEKLKINYRQPLQSSLNKYYSYVTEENKNVNIDIDFKVTVDEISGAKITDYYSKGYRDLFEICKRFALLDVLYEDEKPFIVLDDPFCNFDEKKIANSLQLLQKLSNDYQIVYLVCHNSRSVTG